MIFKYWGEGEFTRKCNKSCGERKSTLITLKFNQRTMTKYEYTVHTFHLLPLLFYVVNCEEFVFTLTAHVQQSCWNMWPLPGRQAVPQHDLTGVYVNALSKDVQSCLRSLDYCSIYWCPHVYISSPNSLAFVDFLGVFFGFFFCC